MTVESVPEISVVIPIYRSAPTLPELFRRVRSTLEAMNRPWEVVLVEDGSPDASWARIAEELAKDTRGFVALRLTRNFGQHNALMCGFRHARARVIVTLDDDLQHPPEEIPKLIATLEDEGLDVVYGIYEEKRHSWPRNLASGFVRLFFRRVFATDASLTSFRAIRREALDGVLPYDRNFTFVDGLLAWGTDRIGEVKVLHRRRECGRSGYSTTRLLTLALNLLTNFSLFPLQLVTAAGFLVALLGFGFGAAYLVLYLRGAIVVPGYASLIIAVLMLGGAQMLALGILGEYLGRLHLNVNRKPQYLVRERLGSPEKERSSKSPSGDPV